MRDYMVSRHSISRTRNVGQPIAPVVLVHGGVVVGVGVVGPRFSHQPVAAIEAVIENIPRDQLHAVGAAARGIGVGRACVIKSDVGLNDVSTYIVTLADNGAVGRLDLVLSACVDRSKRLVVVVGLDVIDA